MAEILLRREGLAVDQLRKLRQAREYFQSHLNQLRKRRTRYVVLHGEQVVGASDDADAAWDQAVKARVPITECLLVHIPAEGESYFY